MFSRLGQVEFVGASRGSVKKGFRFRTPFVAHVQGPPLKPVSLTSPFYESKCRPRHEEQDLHQQASCFCAHIAETPQRKQTIFSWTKDIRGAEEKLDSGLKSVYFIPTESYIEKLNKKIRPFT